MVLGKPSGKKTGKKGILSLKVGRYEHKIPIFICRVVGAYPIRRVGVKYPMSLSQSLRSNFIKNEFVGTNDIYTNILQHHGMPKQVSVKLKK